MSKAGDYRRLANIATAAIALASALPSDARPQHEQVQTFSISAGTLDAALRAIGQQSGREIMYPAELLAGKTAVALAGPMTADEAIRRLLRGSGLVAEFRPDIVIIRGGGAATEADDVPSPEADVVVTGTRIRGSKTPSVRSVSRDRIEKEGIYDLGTFARSLPENFNGGQNPGVVSSGQKDSENANSSSALNLRGLGPDATLTLINGHRAAYDTAGQGVDISAIPLLAIERIDILADGSSALYGSDAVAGVANVVLRRDFSGFETQARIGATTRGGDFQDQLGAVFGIKRSQGGFMVAADYNRSTAINADQREFTRSLDPSATLLPRQRQISIVVSGHLDLSSTIELGFDGQFSDRTSFNADPLLSPGNVRDNGVVTDRRVQSYTISPSLSVEVGPWRIRTSATHGLSTTSTDLSLFLDSEEAQATHVTYRNSLDTLEIGGEGPLLDLPGGSTRLAVGAGWRRVGLDGTIKIKSGAPGYTIDLHPRQNVYFGYGELSLPFVAPGNGVRGIRSLQANAAVRYERYPGVGGVATPKIDVRYEPFAGLALHASWGRSFKAPTLFQSGSVPQGFLLPNYLFSPAPPTADPVLFLAGGGVSLRPEKARTWTAGFTAGPEDGSWSVGGTFFDLRYRDRVLEPIIDIVSTFSPIYSDLVVRPQPGQVQALVATLPQGLFNQTGEPFDNPDAVAAIVDDRLRNIARQNVSGVDLNVRAVRPLSGDHRVTFDASASYLKSDQRASPEQPTIQRAGTIFDPPHWRARSALSYEQRQFSASIIGSYIGGTKDNRFSPVVRVGSFTTVDGSFELRQLSEGGAFANTTIGLAIGNVFDVAPAIIRTTDPASIPFDSTNYSSLGRTLSLQVRKKW